MNEWNAKNSSWLYDNISLLSSALLACFLLSLYLRNGVCVCVSYHFVKFILSTTKHPSNQPTKQPANLRDVMMETRVGKLLEL